MKTRSTVVQIWAATVLLAGASSAQRPDMAMPVRYTEAMAFDVRESLVLTGSVDSRRTSVVASSIAGVVTELRARDGETVKLGATLARLRADTFELQLLSAEGELSEADARLRLAEGRKKRAEDLWDERVISRQQLDDALTEVEASAGRVAQLQADVARFRDELSRTRIRAPFAGVVVAEHTAVGEWLSPGSPVVELVDVGDLEVTLEVPERFFGGLQTGESVQVTFASVPGLAVEGRVRSVVPKANVQSRTFPVKVAIPNDGGAIGVGMLATAQLPIGEAEPSLLVPKDAIVARGSHRTVFVVAADDTVRSVQVRTGKSQGVWVAVAGQIEPGDRVVTQGNERLTPGAKVTGELKEFPKP